MKVLSVLGMYALRDEHISDTIPQSDAIHAFNRFEYINLGFLAVDGFGCTDGYECASLLVGGGLVPSTF